MVIIYTDGSGNGGALALFEDGREFYHPCPGATNNEAEYYGVLCALENCAEGDECEIRTDSQLVVGQLAQGWKINATGLYAMAQSVQELIRRKQLSVRMVWIPRGENRADKALRAHMRSKNGGACRLTN